MSTQVLILLTSIFEVILLLMVIVFFLRLKKSENLINQLQKRQSDLIMKLGVNAKLEQELMATFEKRQKQLTVLARELEERENILKNLLKQANELSRSPQFLRQLVLSGYRKGRSIEKLSKLTGLSADEVELIIEQGGG